MDQDFTELVTRLVFQLAVILAAAKIGGEICERYLKIPPVLGELLAGGGILAAKYISRAFLAFRVSCAPLALALATAFLAAALAESFGLAMIIGAYSIGLALSGTALARQIEEPITAVYHALVPMFFVGMGMMVDVTAIGGVLLFRGADCPAGGPGKGRGGWSPCPDQWFQCQRLLAHRSWYAS